MLADKATTSALRFPARHRNRVERMFNRIKQFRRIATRYDKTAKSLPLLGFLCLAAAKLWLPSLVNRT
jgi:transposase